MEMWESSAEAGFGTERAELSHNRLQNSFCSYAHVTHLGASQIRISDDFPGVTADVQPGKYDLCMWIDHLLTLWHSSLHNPLTRPVGRGKAGLQHASRTWSELISLGPWQNSWRFWPELHPTLRKHHRSLHWSGGFRQVYTRNLEDKDQSGSWKCFVF